jgi:uncharacterized protein (TIGR03086 family)
MNIIDLGSAADHIAAVPDENLGRPAPCSAYSVGDLLDRITGRTVASGGAVTKPGGPTATVGLSGDAGNLPALWRASLPPRVKDLAEVWDEPEAWDAMSKVGGLDLAGAVAGTGAFGELSVHGRDLSRAAKIPFEPDPVGVMALFELVSHAFGGPGQDAVRGTAFDPAVSVPAEAPVFDRGDRGGRPPRPRPCLGRAVNLNPFLLFDGNCAEAMTFYQSCFDGELSITRVADTPMKDQAPSRTPSEGGVRPSADRSHPDLGHRLAAPDAPFQSRQHRGPVFDQRYRNRSDDRFRQTLPGCRPGFTRPPH